MPLGDNSYIIVLNTNCSKGVPISLKSIFDYINDGKVRTGDDFIEKIHDEVIALQEDKEVAQIMTMEEEYERRNTAARREGREEGEAAATLKLAKAMKSEGIDDQAIFMITGLTAEEIKKL